VEGTLQYAAPTLTQQQLSSNRYSTYEDVLAEGDATAVRNAIVKRIEGYVGPAVQSKPPHTVAAAAQPSAAVGASSTLLDSVGAVSSYSDLQQALDDNSSGVTVVAYSALWCRKCRSVYTLMYVDTMLGTHA
jgi:thiol:disulfide interchange protein